MLKTDIPLFNDLTRANDAVRIAAATKLEQRPRWHFKDHPVKQYLYEPAQIESLLEAWKSTNSDLVKAWIAQALALTEIEALTSPPTQRKVEVLSQMADTLKLDGPYMEWVAQFVYEYRTYIPNGNDILRGLYNHTNPGVRWRCAMTLKSFVLSKELLPGDLVLMRRLMLDTDATVRNEAVHVAEWAAERIPGLIGPEDYEVLLDVENIDSDAARTYARELMAKLEASVPGCRREAFAPRVPILHMEDEGAYCANRAELDAAGRWVNNVYLSFSPDGTVLRAFGTDDYLDFRQEYIARGTFTKDGARLSFSCAGYEGRWLYEGHVDADQLHLSSVHAESGRRVEEVYHLLYVKKMYRNLDLMPVPQAAKPTAKKGGLPFIPLRPRSTAAPEAAKWYRRMVVRLPLLLATTPEDSRLMVAWETKRQLRDAAVRALYRNQSLKERFLAAMPLPPLEEWKALHGDNALQELCKLSQDEMCAFPGAVAEASTLDDCIGMQCWDGKETWGMTEQGWQRRGESKR